MGHDRAEPALAGAILPGPAAPSLVRRMRGTSRFLAVMVTVLIGGLASLGAYLMVAHRGAREAELSFVAGARSSEQALNVHLSNAAGVLLTLKAYFESSDDAVSASEYETFSASLRERFAGLRDTGWSPRVTAGERASFERTMQASGFPTYQITERNAEGKLIRARERDEYFPIAYSDPLAPNLIVLGFDVGSEQLRRHALDASIATGQATATMPLTLVNQNRQQQGFISFLPVYTMSRHDHERLAGPLQGVVFYVFETGHLIEDILTNRMHLANTDIYFFDPDRAPGNRLIYWHSSRTDGGSRPVPSEASLLAGQHWIGALEIDKRHWGAIFVPTDKLPAGLGNWDALATLGAGLAMTLVIAAYLGFSIRHAIGLETLTTRLTETTVELRREGEKVNHLACHDVLTGLANRLAFRSETERALRRVRRGERFALLYLDMDRFKDVNDTLGHPIGDALLCEVAHRLQAEVRDGDVVARLGGDEFALLQSGGTQPVAAQLLATRIIEALGAPYSIDDHQILIGVSIGIALAGDGGGAAIDADTLMRNADLAMYRAKQDGRGNLRFFDPDMDAQAQARHKLEMDLRRALELGQFELYYQPLVSMRDRRVSGFEALLRWHHPTRGMVQPGEFIQLAEEIGLIVPIGAWALRAACAEAAGWQVDDGEKLRVAVNVSAVQFTDPNLYDTVAQALAWSGLPADRLELEITESVLLHDVERTLKTLHALHALGVRISMDDFGTGYSSLSYLRRFPFDKIKIDQSFVRNLADSEESGAIVRAVTALGASLRITTLAEGVETRSQLEQLIVSGCTELQGYFFSPPLPAHQIPGLLAESERSWAVA